MYHLLVPVPMLVCMLEPVPMLVLMYVSVPMLMPMPVFWPVQMTRCDVGFFSLPVHMLASVPVPMPAVLFLSALVALSLTRTHLSVTRERKKV